MSKLSVSIIILIIGLVQSLAEDRKYALRLLEQLVAARSPNVLPRMPAPLGRGPDFTDPAVKELANVQYQVQVRLLLAEVQSQLLGTERAHEFFTRATRFGLPSFNNLNFCDSHILSYDNRLRHPSWIMEHISNEQLTKLANVTSNVLNPFMSHSNQGQGIFPEDPNPPLQTVTNQAANQLRCLSGVVPHFPVMNPFLGSRLENYMEHIARNSRNMYVVTGALHKSVSTVQHLGILSDDEDFGKIFYTTFGPNGVAVPTHLFKVVVYQNINKEKTMEAFLIPNKDKVSQYLNLNKYRVHIDKELPKIERDTGLRFFETLDRISIIKPYKLYLDYDG